MRETWRSGHPFSVYEYLMNFASRGRGEQQERDAEKLSGGGERARVGSADAATRKLISKLAGCYSSPTFCYEAGPTGYGLYRLIRSFGQECVVATPRSYAWTAGQPAISLRPLTASQRR